MENYEKMLKDLLTNEPEGARASLENSLRPYAQVITDIEVLCRDALRSDDGWTLFVFSKYLEQASRYFSDKLERANIQIKRTRTVEFNDPDRWKRDAKLEAMNNDKQS